MLSQYNNPATVELYCHRSHQQLIADSRLLDTLVFRLDCGTACGNSSSSRMHGVLQAVPAAHGSVLAAAQRCRHEAWPGELH